MGRRSPISSLRTDHLLYPSITLTTLRGIADDHAFADADQTVYSANGDVVLALHVVNLLRRQDDEWRLVDSRPYAFLPPPE
jgi:hypothetical protein